MHCLVVLSQHNLKLVNVLVVLGFLEGYVDDGSGDVVIHLVEMLDLLDQDFEFLFEIDSIESVLVLL